MSVEITIEPEGLTGLVAEKTYLWHAAKRLGLRLKAECAGRGQCDSCAVTIKHGAELLSAPTQAEEKILGEAKIAEGQRLACQTRIESAGALTFSAVPQPVEEDEMRDFHKDFGKLTLTQKFATLARLEMVALSEALNSVLSVPSHLGEMGLDFLAHHGRQADQTAQATQQPAEHQTTTPAGDAASTPPAEESASESL